MKRLLRYVKGTVDQGIIFSKTDGTRLQFIVFSDADTVGISTDDKAPLACSSSSGRL